MLTPKTLCESNARIENKRRKIININIVKRLIQTVLTLLFQGIILFLSAWTIKWIWAWIFILTGVLILIINMVVIPSEVIEERGRKKENVKKWDKILTTINSFPYIGIYILSGLDYRFNWSINFNISIHITGLLFFILGAMIFTWSMISNKFFSTMVRIQTEREHQVATTGPYKVIRHPGYVGFILMSLATPISLGSLYGLIMSGFVVVILIIRTALEDRTLKNELTGYLEYSKKVKYRLVPFIW